MIIVEPIGVVRTPYQRFYDTPRQPAVDELVDESYVELFAGKNYEQALQDLEGCDRIWLIVYFHRATTWKPKVLPPRGRSKRGVFATRSPHRPNPIGITCCELLRVNGRVVTIRGTDLLDNTPVLDIKPYLPYADSYPDSAVAWVDALEDRSYVVDEAMLDQLPTEVYQHVVRTLQADPLPHPYRRIEELPGGHYEIAVRQYRIVYEIVDNTVRIVETRVVL